MEAVGGAAAVLQLVVALGKSVQVATNTYNDIRGFDESIKDFETQLAATNVHIGLLDKCIRSGNFEEHICRFEQIEAVLISCERSYVRLSSIFVEIQRERSFGRSIRGYVCHKRHASKIQTLRDQIQIGMGTLQLPVMADIIYKAATSQSPSYPDPQVSHLIQDLARRIHEVEHSNARHYWDMMERDIERQQSANRMALLSSNIETRIQDLNTEVAILLHGQSRYPVKPLPKRFEIILSGLRKEIKTFFNFQEAYSLSPEILQDTISELFAEIRAQYQTPKAGPLMPAEFDKVFSELKTRMIFRIEAQKASSLPPEKFEKVTSDLKGVIDILIRSQRKPSLPLENSEMIIYRLKEDLAVLLEAQRISICWQKSLDEVALGLKSKIMALGDVQKVSSLPTEVAADLDLISSSLKKVQIDVSEPVKSQESEPSKVLIELEACDMHVEAEIMEETRSIIMATKSISGSLRNAATTMESMSTSSRATHQESSLATLQRHRKVGRASADFGGFLGAEWAFNLSLQGGKREEISNWADNIVLNDSESGPDVMSDTRSIWTTAVSNESSPMSSDKMSSDYSLAEELHHRRVQLAETMIKKQQFSQAIPHLVRVLETIRVSGDNHQSEHIIQLLAKALGETCAARGELGGLCDKFPSLEHHLDKQRLIKVENLLAESKFDKIVRFLDPEIGANSKKPVLNTSISVQLHLLLSIALVRLKEAEKALPVLNRILEFPSLTMTQKGDVHRYFAESYHLKADWANTKTHGAIAVELNMNSRGRDDEATLSCILIMVNACRKTMDPDEDIWKEMLPDTRKDAKNTGQHKSDDISLLKASKLFSDLSSNPEQRLESLCQNMFELAATDVEEAVDLGIAYLRINYEIDALSSKWYPGRTAKTVCFNCMRQNIKDFITLRYLPRTLKAQETLCRRHRDISASGNFVESHIPCFTLLTFFTIADPVKGQWPERHLEGCVYEIKTLLQLGNPSSTEISIVLKTLLPTVKAQIGLSFTHDKITPVWLAAAFGQKKVVQFLLSLTKYFQDPHTLIETYAGNLLGFPLCNPEGPEIEEKIQASWITLIQEGPNAWVIWLRKMSHILWTRRALPVFDAILARVGSYSISISADMAIVTPMTSGSCSTIETVDLPLLCALVRFWAEARIEPKRVLEILKKHGADFRVVDKMGVAAADTAYTEAKKYLTDKSPSGLKFLSKSPPAQIPAYLQRDPIILGHIQIVQFFRSAGAKFQTEF